MNNLYATFAALIVLILVFLCGYKFRDNQAKREHVQHAQTLKEYQWAVRVCSAQCEALSGQIQDLEQDLFVKYWIGLSGGEFTDSLSYKYKINFQLNTGRPWPY